jgi:RepB DNA-primase from phage plasmid
MTTVSNFSPKSLSASEYVLALFEPPDNVAIVLRHRERHQTLQHITTAETVADPEFQSWLAQRNRSGADVFLGMNPLKDRATNRTKSSVKEIRHVYLDLDENALASLQAIRDSADVPAPNFVLDTSPGKQQVVWKIEGIDQDQAESLLRSLANRFGGDPAATDSTRVLRMPGFANRKYTLEEDFIVRVRQESDQVYHLRDFTVQEGSPDAPRHIEDAHMPGRAVTPSRKTQSERDWAYAKRALARGDNPETVIQRITDYRGNEKHSGYARRTVEKAQKELERETIPSEQRAASMADAGQPGREE